MKKMIIILLFQIVLSLQVQVMAKEVWVFGTKEQVFTQAYKIENSWTIKHYFFPLSKVIAGTFSILSDCALIAPCHALFALATH
jgi:hypothetical protein